MTNMNRRTLVRGLAWTTPVVAMAATAPAFAASAVVCSPTAECKQPGEGSNTKDYAIRTNCVSGQPVVKVEVYDDKQQVWINATPEGDVWVARGFNDSRKNRQVRITTADGGEFVTTIPFPPC